MDKDKLHPYQKRNIASGRAGHAYDERDGAAVRSNPLSEQLDQKDQTWTRSWGFARDGNVVRVVRRVYASAGNTIHYYLDIFRDRLPK
jgi:hypothetical protein